MAKIENDVKELKEEMEYLEELTDGIYTKIIATKPWYQSKTIWAAGLLAIMTGLQFFGITIPAEIYPLIGALGLYGLRTADKKV